MWVWQNVGAAAVDHHRSHAGQGVDVIAGGQPALHLLKIVDVLPPQPSEAAAVARAVQVIPPVVPDMHAVLRRQAQCRAGGFKDDGVRLLGVHLGCSSFEVGVGLREWKERVAGVPSRCT